MYVFKLMSEFFLINVLQTNTKQKRFGDSHLMYSEGSWCFIGIHLKQRYKKVKTST